MKHDWRDDQCEELEAVAAVVHFVFAAILLILVAGLFYACSADYADDLALFKTNAQRFGAVHRTKVDDPAANFDSKLSAYYYDAALVNNQLATYLNDPTYYDYAEKWARFFAEQYVLPANGNIPGFWNFTTGMRRAYERSGTPSLKAAVIAISQNGAYVRDSTTEDTTSTLLSREVAYGIRALIDAAALGVPRQYRLDKLVSDAKGHLRAWCVLQNAPYVRPFMVALTVEALVYSGNADAVRGDIEACATYIWDHNWDPVKKGFRYTDRSIGNADDLEVQPDLNMLIFPIYGWLRWETEKAAILNGGVMRTDSSGQFHSGGAFLFGVKQFNQNHRSAIPYLLATFPSTSTPSPTLTPSPSPTNTPITTPSLVPTPTSTVAPQTPTPTVLPTATPIPTALPTPCPKPSPLTLKYHQCRLNRLVKINGLRE